MKVMHHLSISQMSRERVKVVVLGDAGVGKRDLLISLSNLDYPSGAYQLAHEFGWFLLKRREGRC